MLSIDVEMRCDVMWTRVEEGGGGLSMSKAELPQLAGRHVWSSGCRAHLGHATSSRSSTTLVLLGLRQPFYRHFAAIILLETRLALPISSLI